VSALEAQPASARAGFPTDSTLLDAALVAFAERGFDGASVRELARSLGVSHNFIPQRFGSKERLWFAAVDHGFGQVLAELLVDDDDEADVDDLERFRSVVVRFLVAMGTRPALLQIIAQEATHPGERLEYLFDRYIEPVGQLGTALLDQFGAEGRVRTSSVSLVYFLMTHGAGGAFALPALAARFGDAVDPADVAAVRRHAEHAVDVLFHGLVEA
jgi:AcrR family transcriptional regulator